MTNSTIFSKMLAHRFPMQVWTSGCLYGILSLLLIGSFLQTNAEAAGEDRKLQFLHERYKKLHEQFSKDMNALADKCEEMSYFKDADEIRKRAQLPSAGVYDLDDLPNAPLPPVSLQLPDAERQWRVKLRKLETDYALGVYRIARDAMYQGHSSLVYQWMRIVAFHDPDNRNARAMLGYVLDKGKWTTAFLSAMAAKKMVDHQTFGWLPESHVSRYENGERNLDGEWMSAEREAIRRSDFRLAWEIGSEHFLVKTNHSLEKGVELSRKLEVFHDFFLREYSSFFNTPQQMERLLDPVRKAKWDPAKRYIVYYYRNKSEFVAALKSRQPQIELANGLYLPHERIAFFYFDDGPEETEEQRQLKFETMFHEVTHQLLGESRARTVDVAERANFWAIEGFPCYLESYRTFDGEEQVGDPLHIRIRWARYRAVEESTYWPLRQFTALGRSNFPLEADAYNQAAGLSHFFLHYENGIYRDAFIQYLAEIYNPLERQRPSAVSLEKVMGVKLETLDQQYLDYMASLPDDPPPSAEFFDVER
ncbi:hypothetical protein SH668x_002321 [Planctomicrobium sp. SH668]|uniref:hypothetical protein n=1 Tax=Planctomicrobium sp. SH668 TaxID=3448126 RepID=UPI003F5B8D6B